METTTRQDTVTVAGAARVLGVHPNTVRAWSDQGRLPFMRINARGDRRYRVAALRAFLVAAGLDESPAAPDAMADARAVTSAERGGARLLGPAVDQALARVTASLDSAAIERDLLDHSMALFGATHGAVFTRELDGEATVRVARNLSRSYLAAVEVASPRSRLRGSLDAGHPVAILHAGDDDRLSEAEREAARQAGLRSMAVAPLTAEGDALGTLVLCHDEVRPYDAADLEALRQLAIGTGPAIRNARDYARMATWAAQLRSIQQLGVRLSRLGTVREVGAAIATELQELIDYHNVRVYRLVGRVDLVAVAMRGRVGEYVDETPDQLGAKVGSGLTGWVAEHRQALLVHDASEDPRAETIPGTEPGLDESMLLAPMLFEDEVLGVLVLSKLGLRQFTEDDLRLLEIYASFAAQAMANVDATERLRGQYAQMARWAAQLRSIQQLGVRLGRLASVREIGLAIATELRQLIDYHNVRVYRLQDGDDLVPVAMRGQVGEYVDETPDQLRVRVGRGITGWVAQHGRAQLVDDAAKDPRSQTVPGTQSNLDESMLLAPMTYEDEVLGVLVLSKLGLRQFSQDDLRLLEIYASFAAHAMASADATERLREGSATLARQLRSQQILLQITESILTTLDPRRVLDQIAEGIAALVRYDNLAIAEVNPATGLLRTIVALGDHAAEFTGDWMPGGASFSTWVVQHNEPQLVTDTRQDTRTVQLPGLEAADSSLIAVPLRGRTGPTGVLTLERLGSLDRFSPEEFDLAQLFAAQVSIALQNAEEHRAVEIRAETDALTGLRNKGTFDRQLTQAVARGDRFGLLMLDLDDFKVVNDAQGHQAGDDVLRDIARALRAAVRDTDVVFRYGGDEFALLLPGTDPHGARAVAAKAIEAIGAVGSDGRPGRISCSVGVAAYPDDGHDPETVLLAADRACYVSKRRGRGQISTAKDGMALAGEFRQAASTPVDEPVSLPA